MRELLDTAQYMPVAGRFKVYIIDEVHMLSRHAFNSMLKTLEEPPEHVKFILATTDPQRLPVTVLSRCLQFNLKPQAPPVIAGHLKRVLEAEGIPYEEPALLQLGKAAAGSLRDSLSLLDQAIAHGGGRVAAVQVGEMLGSLGGDLVWPLLDAIASGDGKQAIAESERIAGRSISYEAALEEIASALHRVALAHAGVQPAPDDPDAARVAGMAGRLDPGTVQVMYQIAVMGRRDLALAPDEFAGFTMTVMRMLSFLQPSEVSRASTAAPGQSRGGTPQATSSRAAPVAAPPPMAAAPATPSTPASSAAPSAIAPAPIRAAVAFDGDWPALVERLNLTGMAGMVARHGELVSHENSHFELAVPESHKMYAEKAYQDKLKADLQQHFGPQVRLTVKVGTTTGKSMAAERSRELAKRQSSAAVAIEDDPFVRELVRDLGAEVVSSSIRPAEDAAGPSTKR